jgi:hypothetical protein
VQADENYAYVRLSPLCDNAPRGNTAESVRGNTDYTFVPGSDSTVIVEYLDWGTFDDEPLGAFVVDIPQTNLFAVENSDSTSE